MDNKVGYGFKRLATLFFVAILTIANTGIVFAETGGDSPTAASFKVQHGPTDAVFTGDMQLSVPVTSASARGVSLPVTLDYVGGAGIRVDDEASWVGLGWNLQLGAITRAPVGVVDEKKTNEVFQEILPVCQVGNPAYDPNKCNQKKFCTENYMYGWLHEDETLTGPDGISERGHVDDYETCDRSGSPDKYYIAFSGGAGVMVMTDDEEPKVYMQRWQPWEIDYEFDEDDEEIKSWTITTADGTRYIFEDKGIYSEGKEFTKRCDFNSGVDYHEATCLENIDMDDIPRYTNVWPLTKIISVDYDDNGEEGPSKNDSGGMIEIDYEVLSPFEDWTPYDNACDPRESDDCAFRVEYAEPSGEDKEVWKFISKRKLATTIPWYPTQIKTPTHLVEFGSSYRTTDYGSLTAFKKLDYVLLKEKETGEKLSRINFNYSTGDQKLGIDRIPGTYSEHGKLTLNSIATCESDNPPNELPATKFIYAEAGTGLNPYFDSEEEDDTDAWGYFTAYEDEPLESTDYAKAWTLQSIVYPSGGTVTYEYEADRYSFEGENEIDDEFTWWDSFGEHTEDDPYVFQAYYPDSEYLNTARGGGIRLKSMKIDNGFGTEVKYTYTYGPGVIEEMPEINRIDDILPGGVKILRPQYRFSHLGAHEKNYPGYKYVIISIGTEADEDMYGNIATYFTTISGSHEYNAGSPYHVVTKANDGSVVQESNTEYDYPTTNHHYVRYAEMVGKSSRIKTLYSGWAPVEHTDATLDGVTSETNILEYDAENGLPTRVVGNDEIETVTEYSLKDYERNILTKPYSAKVKYYGGDTVSEAYYGYDEYWRPIETTVYGLYGGDSIVITTSVDYDSYGNVESTTDAMGTSSYTMYDDTYHTYPVASWNDVLGEEWNPVGVISYNSKWLVNGTMDNLNDATSRFYYDEFNRLIRAEGELGSEIETEYGMHKNPTPTNPHWIKTTTKIDDSRDLVAKAFADGFGAALQSQVYNPEEGEWIVSVTETNEVGLPVRAYKPFYHDTDGEYYQSTPSTLYSETSYYTNPLMRVDTVIPPGAETYVTTVYDPDPECGSGYKAVTAIDGDTGRKSISCTNRFGHTVKTVFIGDEIDQETNYEYDDVIGLLLKTIDPSEKEWISTYDGFGRMKTFTHPDLGTVTNGDYDKNGNLLWKTDAKGITINYVYDELNRNTRIDFPTDKDIEYYYDDQCDNADSHKTWGRVCRVVDQAVTTEYKYDVEGKLREEYRTLHEYPDITHTTEYDYYTGGVLKTLTDPDEVERLYEYNNLGQLDALIVDSERYDIDEEEFASYTYNVTGTIGKINFGNGVGTSYGYNARDWLVTIDTHGDEPIFQRHYEFNPLTGNIINIYGSTSTSNLLANFEYDDLDRLTYVTDHDYYGGNMNYTYDAVGNRKSKMEPKIGHPEEFVYHDYLYYDEDGETMRDAEDAETNRMASDGLNDYKYDKNGNTILKVGEDEYATVYHYNDGNRLIMVEFCEKDGYTYDPEEKTVECDELFDEENKPSNEFIYDSAGRRVRKIDSKGETIYIYDTGLNVITEYELEVITKPG